jgi:FkbM family methyltransferase
MKILTSVVLYLFRILGYELVPIGSTHRAWLGLFRQKQILTLGDGCSNLNDGELEAICLESKSQLGQDLLALAMFGPNYRGFFVEFGATDGIEYSNSWLLEKKFGWTGILAEPGKSWHGELVQNRSCVIDKRCVYSSTGEEVMFSEVRGARVLSTISKFRDLDHHRAERQEDSSYLVPTVSLKDLLDFHNAPKKIDFLSIDTEGSEWEILDGFDFSTYSFSLICVEHNYTSNRTKIQELLLSHGYKRVHKELSEFDDWYVTA